MTDEKDKDRLRDVYARYDASVFHIVNACTVCTILLPVPSLKLVWNVTSDHPLQIGQYKIITTTQTKFALSEMIRQLGAAHAMAAADPEGKLDNLKRKAEQAKKDLAVLAPTFRQVCDSVGNLTTFKPFVQVDDGKRFSYVDIDLAIRSLEPPTPPKQKLKLTW